MTALVAITQFLSAVASPPAELNCAPLSAAAWVARLLLMVEVEGGSARLEAVEVDRLVASALGVGDDVKNAARPDCADAALS
jgi:hypothetical protein